MSGSVEGVVQYLNLNDDLAQGRLTWQGVQLDQELIVLVGIIKYPPGAQFSTSEGEVMIVSEKTAEYFTRILRMRLPFDLVNKNSKEETMTFLTELENETQHEVVELPAELTDIQDFNFDDLTDEQKKALLVKTNDKAVH